MRWTTVLIIVLLVSTGCSARAPAESTVPTPTLALPPPTLDLHALSPAGVEEWAGQFYDCVQGDDDFGSGFEEGVESADVGPDFKQFFREELLENRDAFVETLVDGLERRQEIVAVLSVLMGTMLKLCATDDPLPIETMGIDDADIELLLGQFHDCLESDPELRASFLAQGNEKVVSRYLEFLLRDRDWYVGVMYMHTVQGAAAAQRLKAWQDRATDGCA